MRKLVVPKLYPDAAVDAAKLDRILELLASTINGGLDTSALAPGAGIPGSAFAENRSVIVMSSGEPQVVPRNAGGQQRFAWNLGVLPPGTNTLIGVGMIGGFSQVPPFTDHIDVRVAPSLALLASMPLASGLEGADRLTAPFLLTPAYSLLQAVVPEVALTPGQQLVAYYDSTYFTAANAYLHVSAFILHTHE